MNTLIINKKRLIHNIEQIKKYINKSGTDDKGNPVQIIAVVKANGYGLGIVEYTKLLIDNGISFFGVATIEEALKLRKAGIKEDILLMSSTAIKEDIEELIKNNIILTLGSKEDIETIEEIAQKENKKIRCHLKIDTGLGRYGFLYNKREQLVELIKNTKNIQIEGTFSHFSISFYDDNYTKKQFNRFINVVEVLQMNGINTGMLHICNSSATLKFPYMHLNAVRIGCLFLGLVNGPNILGLKEISYLESKITEIKILPKNYNIGYANTYKTKRETKIAIIPCGYSDGVNVENGKDAFRIIDKLRYSIKDIRYLFKKQNIYVQINGKDYKILGRIGTNHIVCDITDSDIKIGDIVKINVNARLVSSSIRREYRDE